MRDSFSNLGYTEQGKFVLFCMCELSTDNLRILASKSDAARDFAAAGYQLGYSVSQIGKCIEHSMNMLKTEQ